MDANKMSEKTAEQVDISFLVKVLRASLTYMVVVGMIVGILAGAFRYFTTKPTYTSSMTYYVNAVSTRSSDGTSVVTPGSTSAARDLAETFTKVVESSMVIDDVVHLHLRDEAQYGDRYIDMNRETIKKMITVSVDTQLLTIEVTHADPTVAYEVARAFESVIPGKLDYCVAIQTASGQEEYESVAKLMDSAELDRTPSGRGSVSFAFFGFLLGAILIYAVAFLRAFFDNTIYTEEDIKTYFTIPVIGQIPTWSNETSTEGKKGKKKTGAPSDYVKEGGVSTSSRDYSGRLLSDKTPFAIAEAFKLLRTNLCYTTKGESCAVFGVTSAYVGAGKSILIANTALSFSQMGKKVLLIDGDLRCPVQHRVFNMDPKTYGLSELLAGVCRDSQQAIRSSDYENLDVITSGRIPPNPAELLASAKFRAFIEEAKERYDVIFIDLPPICEVTDAGVISDIVTGYTFVIRASFSDRRLVNVAVEAMESLGGSIIGFILNDVDIKSGDYYKNKYYGYGGYGKYRKYGRYSQFGRYSKYGKYGKYGSYGNYGYQRKTGDYRYGYSDEELDEQNLEKSDVNVTPEAPKES